MEIQVRTDQQLQSGDELAAFVGFELRAGLGPCAARVLSACVHLTTDWSAQDGPVLRCLLEVNPVGHAPLAVTHHAASRENAVQAAVGDMRGLLERMFRRIDARCRDAAATDATVHQPVRRPPTEGGGSWTSRFGPTTTSTVTRA